MLRLLRFGIFLGLIACLSAFDLFLDEEGNCKSKGCQLMASIKAESLKPAFREALDKVILKHKRDDITNGLPVKYTIVTKHYVQWEPNGQTVAIQSGTDSCGFLGLSSCARYTVSFVPTSQLMIGYELVPDTSDNSCDATHVVCCKGTMLVAGNCLTPTEFSSLTTSWLELLPYIKDELPNYSLQDLAFALLNHGVNLQYTQTKPPPTI